jgi:hypothetical protein
MSVTLAGKLPADDRNGLGTISAALVDNPDAVHVIIALVDCSKVITSTDTGDIVPTARIRAIEAYPGSTSDALEVRRLWRRAMERRTGKFELPLEIEQELDNLTPPTDLDDEAR